MKRKAMPIVICLLVLISVLPVSVRAHAAISGEAEEHILSELRKTTKKLRSGEVVRARLRNKKPPATGGFLLREISQSINTR